MSDQGTIPTDLNIINAWPVIGQTYQLALEGVADRDKIIANQNQQLELLTQQGQAQEAQVSATSSLGSQLSGNIGAVAPPIVAEIQAQNSNLTTIASNITTRLDAIDTKLANLIMLFEAAIQALAGVGTQQGQQQITGLLEQIIETLAADKPASFGIAAAPAFTEQQPVPVKPGPS